MLPMRRGKTAEVCGPPLHPRMLQVVQVLPMLESPPTDPVLPASTGEDWGEHGEKGTASRFQLASDVLGEDGPWGVPRAVPAGSSTAPSRRTIVTVRPFFPGLRLHRQVVSTHTEEVPALNLAAEQLLLWAARLRRALSSKGDDGGQGHSVARAGYGGAASAASVARGLDTEGLLVMVANALDTVESLRVSALLAGEDDKEERPPPDPGPVDQGEGGTAAVVEKGGSVADVEERSAEEKGPDSCPDSTGAGPTGPGMTSAGVAVADGTEPGGMGANASSAQGRSGSSRWAQGLAGRHGKDKGANPVLAWLEDVKECNQSRARAPGTVGVLSTDSAGGTDERLRRALEQFLEAMSASLGQLTGQGVGGMEGKQEELRSRFCWLVEGVALHIPELNMWAL